jgi:hypothetical protein
MKVLILTLCILITFLNNANAGELYICSDENGNEIITTTPQDGMKDCVLKDSYEPVKPVKKVKNAKKAIAYKTANIRNEQKSAEQSEDGCIKCCNNKMVGCYNNLADKRLCEVENQNCVATCESDGSSPSSWRDCLYKSKE